MNRGLYPNPSLISTGAQIRRTIARCRTALVLGLLVVGLGLVTIPQQGVGSNLPEMLAESRVALEQDSRDLVLGNPKGIITIVEFSDYLCGVCRRLEANLEDLIKTDSRVRLVVKQYPILGEFSLFAASVVLAAQAQGMDKAQKLHERLFKTTSFLRQQTVLQAAEEVGLDRRRLEVDMKLPEVKAQLAEINALADRFKISGVPGLVIGNRVVHGAPDRAGLDRYVERVALERDTRDLVLGNPKGTITIVEFTDYLCRECRRFESELKELIKSDSRIRLVVKQYPLQGDNSVFAASVVLAAQPQGMDRVLELHEQLLKSTDAELQQQTVLEAAKQVGLDMKRLEADLKLPQIKTQLAETSALAKRFVYKGSNGIVIGNSSGSPGGFWGASLQRSIADEAMRIENLNGD